MRTHIDVKDPETMSHILYQFLSLASQANGVGDLLYGTTVQRKCCISVIFY